MLRFFSILLVTVVVGSVLVLNIPKMGYTFDGFVSQSSSDRQRLERLRCHGVTLSLPVGWSLLDVYPEQGCDTGAVYEVQSSDGVTVVVIRSSQFGGYGDARQGISGYTELAVSGFEQLENGLLVSSQGGYGSESGLVQSASVEPGVYYSVYQQSPGGYSSQLVFGGVELSVVYAVNSPLPGVNWSLYGGQLRSVVESISVD